MVLPALSARAGVGGAVGVDGDGPGAVLVGDGDGDLPGEVARPGGDVVLDRGAVGVEVGGGERAG